MEIQKEFSGKKNHQYIFAEFFLFFIISAVFFLKFQTMQNKTDVIFPRKTEYKHTRSKGGLV